MVLPLVLVIFAAFRVTAGLEDRRFLEIDELEVAPSDLRFAFIIFRHGMSNLLNVALSKNETRDLENTSEGTGVLTPAGWREMLHVGRSLRTRYRNHVPPTYNPDIVLVTSTDKERTYLSARKVAAGMFPSTHDIPVDRNTPYDKHWLFGSYTSCPAYNTLRERVLDEEKARQSRSSRKFYKKLNKKLRKKYSVINSVASLDDVSKVWEPWKMELDSKPLPKWINKIMPKLDHLAWLSKWRSMHAKTGMLQFYSGTMLHQIMEEMEDQTVGMGGHLRLHLHGSHETTVCAVFWAMVPRQETYFAQPGDTMILEMYTDETVKLFHYSPLEKKAKARFQVISLLPLCQADPCPLDKLKRLLVTDIADEEDWRRKCTVDETAGEKLPAQDRKEPKHVHKTETLIREQASIIRDRVIKQL